MQKIMLTLLLAAATTAQAASVAGSITVQGMQFQYYVYGTPWEGGWEPSNILVANFTGEDVDGNSIITKNELTSFVVNGGNLFHDMNFLAPDDDQDQYLITDFTFRGAQEYSIVAAYRWQYPDPIYGSGGGGLNLTQDGQTWSAFHFAYDEYRYTSTSETVVTVVSSVPEPMTITMLGLGLAIVGSSARRRRRTITR